MITVFVLATLLAVQGDFNHDGDQEFARVIRSSDGYEIVVERRNGQGQIVSRGDFNDPYVAINRARGWVRTACGKGYDLPSCTRHSPKKIFLRGGELLFGDKESSDFVLLYRGSRPVVVQLTD